MSRIPGDLRGFYAVIDPEFCVYRDPEQVANMILRGGCAAMQLRVKSLSDEAFLTLGRKLAALCQKCKVPLFINDRPDIALTVNADGVHLGQTDMGLEAARLLLGERLIGVSTHTPDQARKAVAQGANLIGYGPVFSTTTKANPDPIVGLDGLAEICRWAPVPVVAIGGITLDTTEAVAAAGASMICAISAVCGAEDPARVAGEMHQAVLRRR